MADEEKNETTEEETPEVEAVAEEPVADECRDAEVADDLCGRRPRPRQDRPRLTPFRSRGEAPPSPSRSRSRQRLPRSSARSSTCRARRAARARRSCARSPKTRKPITRTGKPESELGRRQERRGVVVSDKGDKTIVVKVDVIKSHPKYKKVVRSTVKFHAHDEANTAGVGDTVRIIETRPLSKQKRWRLAEIVEKAK